MAFTASKISIYHTFVAQKGSQRKYSCWIPNMAKELSNLCVMTLHTPPTFQWQD